MVRCKEMSHIYVGCGTVYHGRVYHGRVYQGRVYHGRVYQGRVYQGRVYHGKVYQGRVYHGRVYQGRVYRGRVYQGGREEGRVGWLRNPALRFSNRHRNFQTDTEIFKRTQKFSQASIAILKSLGSDNQSAQIDGLKWVANRVYNRK